MSLPAFPLKAETRSSSDTLKPDAQLKKLKAIIRELPQVYALTDPSTDRKTFAIRLGISLLLLADRFSVPVEVLKEGLAETAKSTLRNPDSPRMEKASALFVIGDFSKAEEWALAAGDEAHRDKPRRPATIVEALQLAAYAAIVQRHYGDAHRYLRVAMGETHPDRDVILWADIQATQAHLEWLSDQPDRRIRTLRGIYEECRKSLGEEHVATLRRHNELASALYDHQHDAEAEKEFRAVLKIMERTTDEPDGAAIQTLRKNLAKVLEVQKRYGEAMPLRESIVKSQTLTLGPDHPDTLRSRFDLALNFSKQNLHEDTIAEFSNILDTVQRALGKDNPFALECRNALAHALYDGGKFVEALTQFRLLRTQYAKLHGEKHEETQEAISAIGVCLIELERYAEAETLLKDLRTLRTRLHGPESLLTLETRSNLANAYTGQEKWKEAEAEYTAVLEIRRRTLGTDDPMTLGALHNLTGLQMRSAKHREELIGKQVAALANAIARDGPSAELTILARLRLAGLYSSAARWAEAEKEFREALQLREEDRGKDHPDTLRVRAGLALALLMGGRMDEAVTLYEGILEVQQRNLDPDDPAFLECLHEVAYALARQGKDMERARKLAATAHEGLLAKLGPEHESTVHAKQTLAFVNQPPKPQVRLQSLMDAVTGPVINPRPLPQNLFPPQPTGPPPTIIQPLRLGN